MQYTYLGIFLISTILIPLYFFLVRKKQSEPWLFVLFLCVVTVNLGYTLIAFSGSVEFALFSNNYRCKKEQAFDLLLFDY